MITTRLALTPDIPVCADLHVQSCLDIYRPYVSAEVHATSLPANLRALWSEEKLTSGDFILMAFDCAEAVGIVTVRNRSTPYIDHFHVKPDRKGRGIGGVLMRAVAGEMIARGMTHCYLDVAKGNDPALAFYIAMGGEVGEEIMGDLFGHPIPAQLIRWRDLSQVAGLDHGRGSEQKR